MRKYTFEHLKTTNPEAWSKFYAKWLTVFGSDRILVMGCDVEAGSDWHLNALQYRIYSDFLCENGAEFDVYTPEGYEADVNGAFEKVLGSILKVVLKVIETGGPQQLKNITDLAIHFKYGDAAQINYNAVASACRIGLQNGLLEKRVIDEDGKRPTVYMIKGVEPANMVRKKFTKVERNSQPSFGLFLAELRKAGYKFHCYGKYGHKLRVVSPQGVEGFFEIDSDRLPKSEGVQPT